MSHVIEPATSGRAKCRGCGEKIAKDELRFGEVTENPYGDGDRTLWFHPLCGAYKRPEPFVEAMAATLIEDGSVADLEAIETPAAPGETIAWLRDQSRFGLDHRRLPRIDGAGRAPTSRAHCRSCREPITKDSWRIGLVFYEEGYFNPSGFIHVGCWRNYLQAEDEGPAQGEAAGEDVSRRDAPNNEAPGEPLDPAVVLARLAHFSPELTPTDLAEIDGELKSA
ncbi:MAG: hypothetical protein IH849_09915 [Acidobacteria bacterium]|nr:hypothetical protein [Acidobacteriota bacterium]